MSEAVLKNGDLTGRRRFRVEGTAVPTMDWFKVKQYLILQVEYNEWVSTKEGKPGRWVCMWRDATPDDVPESQLCS